MSGRNLPALAVLLILTGFGPVRTWGQDTGQGGPLEEILAGVQEFRRGVTDLRGEFRQVREMALLAGAVESEGEVFYQPPDQLLLRFTSPEESQLLVKGRDVWVYSPAAGEAQHYDLGPHNTLAGLFVGLGGGEGELNEVFDISLGDERDGPTLLLLTPRAHSSLAGDLERVELLLGEDSYQPETVRLYGLGGDVLKFTLTEAETNTGLDPSLFEFSPPPGVTIVDYSISRN